MLFNYSLIVEKRVALRHVRAIFLQTRLLGSFYYFNSLTVFMFALCLMTEVSSTILTLICCGSINISVSCVSDRVLITSPSCLISRVEIRAFSADSAYIKSTLTHRAVDFSILTGQQFMISCFPENKTSFRLVSAHHPVWDYFPTTACPWVFYSIFHV